MNNLKMKLCGDLILREKCTDVEKVTPELILTLDEMVRMMDDENGVGLAAPQIGITQRFLVMMNPDSRQIYKMINPKFISKSEKTCRLEEGCLSVLGNDGLPVFSYVVRPESAVIEWTDETGKRITAEMNGATARVAQHEMDHLEGILFIDYLSPVKREMLMRKVKKFKV